MKQNNIEPTDAQYIERLEYCQYPMNCCICNYRDNCFLDNKKTVDLIHRQKAEIERLGKVETELQSLNAEYYNEAKDLKRENSELQKQVDELKEKIMNLKSAMISRVAIKSYDSFLTTPDDVEEIFGDTYESEFNEHLKQAVKDTAKEILQEGKYCLSKSLQEWIKERYGVEVE